MNGLIRLGLWAWHVAWGETHITTAQERAELAAVMKEAGKTGFVSDADAANVIHKYTAATPEETRQAQNDNW